jgi:hypothetical protein
MRTESGVRDQKVTTLYLAPVASEKHRPPANDLPTADEILRLLPKETISLMAGVNIERRNVVIVVEKTGETVDDCRFFPQVGNARLKKRHYKCTVYYDKTTRSKWPVPFMDVHTAQADVSIDRNHLIPCDGAASSPNAASPKTNRD